MKKEMSQFEKMTTTPVSKLIISLSVPTIISMLVTNIYNLVDTAFVGTLGNSASGAVGVVFGFMSILQAIGFMFGQGAGSILSRKLGKNELDSASDVASAGFFGAFILSTVVAFICYIFLDPLVYALGSTPTIAPFAKTYIGYILIAAPFLTTSFTLNNLLRYEGKAALGMVGLMTGGIVNICGDAIFMFGLHMGIAGAGLSTCLSQILSFTILLSMFLRKKSVCEISIKRVHWASLIYWDICSTGFPSMLRQGLNSISTVLLNAQASVYGDEAVSAMSIVSRVMFFAFSIAIGIGQGFQPVSGYNYGAKRMDRVKKGYYFTFTLSEILMVILCTVLMFTATPVITVFRNDMTVVNIGVRALRWQCIGQLVLPFCMATEMLFQSTGNKLYATILSGTRSGLIFIPVLLILSNLRGLAGIQEAQAVANVISLIPAVWFAIRYWRKVNVIN